MFVLEELPAQAESEVQHSLYVLYQDIDIYLDSEINFSVQSALTLLITVDSGGFVAWDIIMEIFFFQLLDDTIFNSSFKQTSTILKDLIFYNGTNYTKNYTIYDKWSPESNISKTSSVVWL
ncbi:unnamed protein product [Ambrosiozyma monospora]|uniref:Unnamed protein product n=1 Tax=Ambrosiozyma monospora TaxID=43982 RepID=A0ACB5SZG5_AMBMO|nr:unnamed protein product [Ambrosiozyma monospora]